MVESTDVPPEERFLIVKIRFPAKGTEFSVKYPLS